MKLPQTSPVNRLCIYFFYDKDGIIDDYVVDVLKDISQNTTRILLVSNIRLTEQSKEKLSIIQKIEYTERPNKGFDVWAYKHGIEYVGWENLNIYDEVIFMNFTIVGPLYPLKEMFNTMAKRTCDFWGINVYSGEKFDPWGVMADGVIPKHIQSHFIVVRKRMIGSPEFRKYWDTMRPILTYQQAIGYHEAIFTKTFSDLGYKWSSYINTEDLEAITSYPLMFMPKEIILNRRCPFFKRKAFLMSMDEYMGNTTGRVVQDIVECLDYLNYDMTKFFSNILRHGNQSGIRITMNATRVLDNTQDQHTQNTGIALFVTDENQWRTIEKYIPHLAGIAKIVIIARERAYIERLHLGKQIETHVGGISMLIDAIAQLVRNMDAVGVIDLRNDDRNKESLSALEGGFYVMEPMFGSADRLKSAAVNLANQTVCGLYVTQEGVSYPLDSREYMSWQQSYTHVLRLTRKLGIHQHIQLDKTVLPLTAHSGVFLLKSQAVRHIDWSIISHYMESVAESKAQDVLHSLLPYVVQSCGYIAYTTYSKETAQNMLSLKQYISQRGISAKGVEDDIMSENTFLAKMYMDRGHGFNENDIESAPVWKLGKNSASFKFVIEQKARSLRFDPVEGVGVICKKVIATINGTPCNIQPLNSIRYADSVDIFITTDPQYLIKKAVRPGDVVSVTMEQIDYYFESDFSHSVILSDKGLYGGTLHTAVSEMQSVYQNSASRRKRSGMVRDSKWLKDF